MNETKPIVRSMELQALSREHSDGLLFIDKIRQGLYDHISLDKLQQYVRWFWKNHIRPHFFQEEKILLSYMPADHPLVKKLKDDHAEIRELMISIDRDLERYDLIGLANCIEQHIRWEEEEFFQYLESNLSAAELKNIYEELNNHPVSCEVEWSDGF